MKNEKKGRPRKPVAARKCMTKEELEAWHERNADAIARVNSDRQEAGLGKANALKAKARTTVMGALPAWADLKAIEAKYAEAARLGMVVDHVIPLKGNQVCGLHVEGNLRLLTKRDNLRKGNRYISD